MRRVNCRRGLTLLEVIAALAILGVAGGAFIALAGQSISSASSVTQREQRVIAAGAELSRLASMTRSQVVANAGRHRRGDLVVSVYESDQGLYAVLVSDAISGSPLVSTSLSFADTSDVE